MEREAAPQHSFLADQPTGVTVSSHDTAYLQRLAHGGEPRFLEVPTPWQAYKESDFVSGTARVFQTNQHVISLFRVNHESWSAWSPIPILDQLQDKTTLVSATEIEPDGTVTNVSAYWRLNPGQPTTVWHIGSDYEKLGPQMFNDIVREVHAYRRQAIGRWLLRNRRVAS